MSKAHPMQIHETTDAEREAALQEFFAVSKKADAFRASATDGLNAAAPVLEKVLRDGWDTGQGTKVRAILWSLYNGSGLVQLGYQCSGLDTKVAEALAAAITARLALGADVEETLRGILKRAGEFDRYEETARRTPGSFPVVYPVPPVAPARLHAIADSIEEASKTEAEE